MSIKVGSKMLYCKIVGDKSSEEVVEVVAVQSEAEGGGVTIYIPSLKRERDTELTRLSAIVEKKATLDTFFGKPKLELPYVEREKYEERIAITKESIKVYYRIRNNPSASVDVTPKVLAWFDNKPPQASFNERFGDPFPGQHKEVLVVFIKNGKTIEKTFDENNGQNICILSWITQIGDCHEAPPNISTACHVRADKILLDNQRLLFNQLNSLKESLKVLQKKPVVADENPLLAEINELRRLNTSLLMNQQVMAKELAESKKEIQEMRAEMALFRRFIPTVEAVPISEPSPIISLGKVHKY